MTEIGIRFCRPDDVVGLFTLIRELAIAQGDLANFEFTLEELKSALSSGRTGA
jgi:hypothetical protein